MEKETRDNPAVEWQNFELHNLPKRSDEQSNIVGFFSFCFLSLIIIIFNNCDSFAHLNCGVLYSTEKKILGLKK